MQRFTLPEPLQSLIADVTVPYIVRILLIGSVTFLVFFLILKTTERHNTRDKIIRIIRDKWEKILYGDFIPVVKDGVVQLDKLYKADVTTQQIFDVMRLHNINNIALIKRMYVNPDHEFRVLANQATPAIPVLHSDIPQTEEMKNLKEIN